MSDNKEPIQPVVEEHSDLSPITFLGRLRNYFLAGVLVTAPISITVYLTYSFLMFVDSKIVRLVPEKYNPDYYLPFSLPGLGLIIVILFFIIIEGV